MPWFDKAFPQPVAIVDGDRGNAYYAGDELVEGSGGMTLRDWFAGQVIVCVGGGSAEEKAMAAYDLADAMLARRDML